MTIPPFKPVVQDKVAKFVDKFHLRHEREVSEIKKEKLIAKKQLLKEAQERVMKQLLEEKIVLKENNERWKMLNIIR